METLTRNLVGISLVSLLSTTTDAPAQGALASHSADASPATEPIRDEPSSGNVDT
jgi:hypothetical protein